MEFLDPAKETRHRIIMWIGYVLIAVGIVIATFILLYEAYGFGINKNGNVIQNGLVFFSSQPNPANIYLNGKLNKASTNARVVLPAGIYRTQLERSGYHTWQRTIEVEGGDVQHFDYPFLIPNKLTQKTIKAYAGYPGLMTQSPDRRWLLVETPGSSTSFSVYDLKNPTKAPETLDLPASAVTKAQGSESFVLEEWADDDKHVVLQHNYDGKSEFILVDRTNAANTQNLNAVLSSSPTKLTLDNKKYDQYYMYDSKTAVLQSATLSAPTPKTLLEHVLAYQSYSDDTLLYATDNGDATSKVYIKLKIGSQTYPVRDFPSGASPLLDLTEYSGTLYVAAGATGQDKVYIYKDPVGQLHKLPGHALVPDQVLHVPLPNYVSFSDNAQFIVAENGTQFGVYDIENKKGYNYAMSQPIDPPQAHATWMDGDRMTYVSNGKLIIFDYDGTNEETLLNALSPYLPAFAPDFKFVYTLSPAKTAAQADLDQTSLLAPADQ
ncbi:MAG TPA: PEGA domain-containing protein [Candidatus Saccharimonadales bacterium]|nr:PEGA domain-containing protein [Candidatus Saccharimonadales bacterium]